MFQQSKHRLQRRTVQFSAANIEEVEARGIQLVADLQPHSEMTQNPTHWTF